MTHDAETLGELADRARRSDEALFATTADERERQKLVKAKYAALFAAATQLFFRVDPIGINFESNADEYEPEVGTVLPRLESARSVGDVERILREEFSRWFGNTFDGHTTDRLAPELWALWKARESIVIDEAT
jgi:hypothetical protein